MSEIDITFNNPARVLQQSGHVAHERACISARLRRHSAAFLDKGSNISELPKGQFGLVRSALQRGDSPPLFARQRRQVG